MLTVEQNYLQITPVSRHLKRWQLKRLQDQCSPAVHTVEKLSQEQKGINSILMTLECHVREILKCKKPFADAKKSDQSSRTRESVHEHFSQSGSSL